MLRTVSLAGYLQGCSGSSLAHRGALRNVGGGLGHAPRDRGFEPSGEHLIEARLHLLAQPSEQIGIDLLLDLREQLIFLFFDVVLDELLQGHDPRMKLVGIGIGGEQALEPEFA